MFDTEPGEADPDGTAGPGSGSASPEITDAPDGPAEAGAADRSDRSDRPERPERPSGNVFDRSYLDSMHRRAAPELNTEASWDDEGHFVPPPPPPLPVVEPHRRLAWAGLLGTPFVTLLLIGAGIRVTGWMAFLLAIMFVGGFGYLVATMRSGPPDDFSGDDGARI